MLAQQYTQALQIFMSRLEKVRLLRYVTEKLKEVFIKVTGKAMQQAFIYIFLWFWSLKETWSVYGFYK